VKGARQGHVATVLFVEYFIELLNYIERDGIVQRAIDTVGHGTDGKEDVVDTTRRTPEAPPGVDAELLDQIMELADRITAEVGGGLPELGLTTSQANLLWLLDPQREALPLRHLADRLHCDPSNVTLLATQLQRQGLAERTPHPSDRRARVLTLTEDGARVRARLIALAAARSPLSGLDEGERRVLHDLLAKTRDRTPV
jgi:MarR family transcriptional regulator, organic hydroperoxide resistance regulator